MAELKVVKRPSYALTLTQEEAQALFTVLGQGIIGPETNSEKKALMGIYKVMSGLFEANRNDVFKGVLDYN